MKTNRLKKIFYSTALSAFAVFAMTGCMEEREIPTDDLVTLYNSDMEKTSKMNPLDTMYAQVGGLGENKRYEIRVLDSDKNYITSTQVMTDENGTVAPTAIWYDIGVAKPDASNNSFHIKKYDTLQLKSFYINVVDIDTNGANTNFYQPFYYVSSTNAVTQDALKPVIYACNSNGVIENAFEETGSKDMNGNNSILTKVYLKVDTLPTVDYTGLNNPLGNVQAVDVYVVPFNSGFKDDINISELNATIALHNVNISDLNSSTGKLIWDLNDPTTKLVNPNERNSAYSIIIDLNKDGKYTVGTDLNGDGLTDRYVDAVDGGLVPGFIIQNTPANELTYSLTNSAGEEISSVPECINGKGGSVYLNIENLMTSNSLLDVDVNGANVVVDILEPQYGTDGRYLKYIEKAKIFDSCTAPTNVADGATTDIAVNIDHSDLGGDLDINKTITVYSVLTDITTTNGETNTTVFDETGTVNGDTKIYLLSDTTYNANVYLFDGNTTVFDTTKALASKMDVNLTANASVLAFDLNKDINITNPKDNNGMYKIFVDSNNDKNLTISIRDTAQGNLPDVGYINIASKGINYYEFDNHYNDSEGLSVYGYIDEFKADGSNTEYSYDDYYWGQGLKVIWNPYIKNRSKGGYFGNYWGSYGSTSTYTDFSGDTQPSPFSFNQRVAIYIIDADQYKLQAGMTLDGKDVRGYATIVTVQYSCSNGAGQQVVWKPNMRVGNYYMILDMDMDGKLTEGVDFVDAVDKTGKTIKEDSSVVGFKVVN